MMRRPTEGIASATAGNKPTARAVIPDALADVALGAADTCAAIGEMSVSWWHEEVRAGRAPKPVIQQPRCTRWRLADVRRFWIERAEQGATDTQAAADVKARASKASAAARVKRAAPTAQAAK